MNANRIFLFRLYIIITIPLLFSSACTHNADISGLPEVCFTSDVLPVFLYNCTMANCHDGSGESEFPLRTYSEIMEGITPGNPGSSEIYRTITAKWGGRMPPDQPLSLENRTLIRVWIEQGAIETTCPDPSANNPGGPVSYIARACFTRDIQPVVVSHCATAGCHDAISHKEGYNYTSYIGIRNSVTPGLPSSSKLYRVVTTSGEEKMPPLGSPQLTSIQIDSIKKWIVYGALNENCGEVCDTIDPITFSGTLMPLIQLTCTGCHTGSAPAGNILLTSYSNVAAVASNGMLMNSLNGNGVTRMPPSGPLSACRIRQFQIWVKSGYQNN